MVWRLVLAAYPVRELGKVLTRSMRNDGGVAGEDKKQQKGKGKLEGRDTGKHN